MPITDPEIFDKVASALREQLGLAPDARITPEMDFYADLNGDSLDMAELIMKLEEMFDISAPPDADPRKIGDIAEKVQTLLMSAKR
jgi:acyl carrier protein